MAIHTYALFTARCILIKEMILYGKKLFLQSKRKERKEQRREGNHVEMKEKREEKKLMKGKKTANARPPFPLRAVVQGLPLLAANDHKQRCEEFEIRSLEISSPKAKHFMLDNDAEASKLS